MQCMRTYSVWVFPIRHFREVRMIISSLTQVSRTCKSKQQYEWLKYVPCAVYAARNIFKANVRGGFHNSRPCLSVLTQLRLRSQRGVASNLYFTAHSPGTLVRAQCSRISLSSSSLSSLSTSPLIHPYHQLK